MASLGISRFAPKFYGAIACEHGKPELHRRCSTHQAEVSPHGVGSTRVCLAQLLCIYLGMDVIGLLNFPF
jgi:hypothetical protein